MKQFQLNYKPWALLLIENEKNTFLTARFLY